MWRLFIRPHPRKELPLKFHSYDRSGGVWVDRLNPLLSPVFDTPQFISLAPSNRKSNRNESFTSRSPERATRHSEC